MKILVVEDEPDLRESIKDQLENENFTVETAGNFNGAMEKLGSYEYDCILLDITLPGGNGLDLLDFHKKIGEG